MKVKKEVFKTLRCKCGKQSYEDAPLRVAPLCPRCGLQMKYSDDWYIKVRIDGRRHIQKVGRQQRQAESVLREASTEIFQEKYFGHKKTEDLSWQDAADRFDTFCLGNCRASTAKMYRNRLGLMGRLFFNRYTLQEINDPELVNGYKTERLAAGVSGSGVNRELASIKRMAEVFTDGSIMNTARRPYLEFNRLNRVKKCEENPGRERFPSVEEMVRLIRCAVNDRFRTYLYIMLFSGLRPSNARSLEWSELYFDEKQIIIPGTKSKNRRSILVDLLDPLAECLNTWRKSGHSGERYVLPGDKDPSSHYKSERTAFSRTCAAANITGLTPHCLRHGVATLLAEMNDGNLRMVQETLNQNSLAMARRYTHMRGKIRQDGMNKMGNALESKINEESTKGQPSQ